MTPNPLKLNEVWRICNKLRTLIAKFKIDIYQKFSSCDCSLISASRFLAILDTLHPEFELMKQEKNDLVEFFQDAREKINFKSFIEILQLHLDEDNGSKEFVSGLEWEDTEHINHLSPFEHRHVNMILTKIAHSCRLRDIILEPYFQDYEEMSKNGGTITITHFRRVLNFLGITLGVKEFRLVVKKFAKHNYTVNYCAFVAAIRKIYDWFDENVHVCTADCFPGTIIECDFERMPRPEFDEVVKLLEMEKPCHSCMKPKEPPRDIQIEELMLRIKKHILDNRVRSREFFEKFDVLKRGFVTRNQFVRALESLGISGLSRLYVARDDMEKVMAVYADPMDPDRVNWFKFCDDVDEVFIIKNLHKQPYRVVECPPPALLSLNRPGTADWECIPRNLKQLAQETVFKLRHLIHSRQIFIEQFFKNFDPHNNKHVSKCQMRRAFSSNGIILSDKEISSLMLRYGNDLGFNYFKFLKDIADVEFCDSKHEKVLEMLKMINAEQPPPCAQPEVTIIEVLAKIKGEIVRRRINYEGFIRNGEVVGDKPLSVKEFRRNFSAAGIILEECELDVLCNSLKLCGDPYYVDHKLFIELMNQAYFTTQLEKNPHAHPHQFLPTHDGLLNFLNFEERCIVSNALQKLSKHNDTNMTTFFEDYEGKSGDVKKENLIRVLTICGLIELLTEEEIDVLFKCFTVRRGCCKRFDYKNFLAVIDEVAAMK